MIAKSVFLALHQSLARTRMSKYALNSPEGDTHENNQ